jgi:hypothetical protein
MRLPLHGIVDVVGIDARCALVARWLGRRHDSLTGR